MYNFNRKLGSLHESLEELQVKEEAISQKEQEVAALQRETEERVKETGLLLESSCWYGKLLTIT